MPAETLSAEALKRLTEWEVQLRSCRHDDLCIERANDLRLLLSSSSVSGVGVDSARAVPLSTSALVDLLYEHISIIQSRPHVYVLHGIDRAADAIRNAAPTLPDEVLERMARAFVEAWQPRLGLMDEEMRDAKEAMRAALAAAETSPPGLGRRASTETSPEAKP